MKDQDIRDFLMDLYREKNGWTEYIIPIARRRLGWSPETIQTEYKKMGLVLS